MYFEFYLQGDLSQECITERRENWHEIVYARCAHIDTAELLSGDIILFSKKVEFFTSCSINLCLSKYEQI
jgi:hypothetical protein